MKKPSVLLACLLVLAACSLSVPQTLVNPAYQQFFEKYAEEKDRILLLANQQLPRSPIIERWISDFLSVDPYLKRELPLLRGKTLHVVLQMHHEGRAPSPAADASQAKVFEILERLNPKLLSLEGVFLDRYTKEGFREEIQQANSEISQALNQEPRQGAVDVDFFITRSAALRYATNHPECHAIGGERRSVHFLNGMALLAGSQGKGYELFYRMSRVRSWVVAARMSDFMQRLRLNEGVIVIGAAHAEDLKLLSDVFGVKVVFYDTTTSNP